MKYQLKPGAQKQRIGSGNKMPQIGDICKARDLGYKGYHRYMWHACIHCGKERWASIRKGKPSSMCSDCHLKLTTRPALIKALKDRTGNKSSKWKGGRWRTSEGYVRIYVPEGDFFHTMADKQGYAREHRLIIARYLNRCLLPWEVVHHKNGVRDDNRLENLQLMSRIRHHAIDTTLKATIAKLQKRIDILEKRVTQLEVENVLLKSIYEVSN